MLSANLSYFGFIKIEKTIYKFILGCTCDDSANIAWIEQVRTCFEKQLPTFRDDVRIDSSVATR